MLTVLGVLCLIGAAGFNYYNEWESDNAGERSEQLLEELLEIDSLQTLPPSESDDSIPPSEEDSGEDCVGIQSGKSAVVQGLPLCGYIEIDSIGVRLPVIAEYSESNLAFAPCKYMPEGEDDGRLVIAAHNYTRHFARLGSVSTGDRVRFTNVDGKVYNFAVSEVCVINSDDFSALQEGNWSLAMFTCNFSGQMRILVRCVPA